LVSCVLSVEKTNKEHLIKRMMLKNEESDDLKVKEVKYLQSRYGNLIPDLDIYLNKTTIFKIHLRTMLVRLLQTTLRDINLTETLFVHTIAKIELNINKHLIPDGR
jgi:hypothetical protein